MPDLIALRPEAPPVPAAHRPPLRVVALFGSPSTPSRSAALLRGALRLLADRPLVLTEIDIRALPAQALLQARRDEPALQLALAAVAGAELLLVTTPIYKAAYSGLLKLFLDLLPQDGLRHARVLPLATGGSVAHLLAVDYALRPVLAALGAREVLDTVFATDAQFDTDASGAWQPDAAVRERLQRALAGRLDAGQPAERFGTATAAC
jgi:FMN reductase